MDMRAVQFFAVVLTALALVPSGAQLFELPNKIGLPWEGYFTVQGITMRRRAAVERRATERTPASPRAAWQPRPFAGPPVQPAE